jgi:antitoxin component YwqK of YwqJK toxin-antitoxin module
MAPNDRKRTLLLSSLVFVFFFMLGVECRAEDVRKTYYSNGFIKTEAHYEHGKLNGIFKQFFQNGKVQLQYAYKDDVLNGKSIEYYPNGKLKEEMIYEKGEIKHLRLYDEKGKLILSKF